MGQLLYQSDADKKKVAKKLDKLNISSSKRMFMVFNLTRINDDSDQNIHHIYIYDVKRAYNILVFSGHSSQNKYWMISDSWKCLLIIIDFCIYVHFLSILFGLWGSYSKLLYCRVNRKLCWQINTPCVNIFSRTWNIYIYIYI